MVIWHKIIYVCALAGNAAIDHCWNAFVRFSGLTHHKLVRSISDMIDQLFTVCNIRKLGKPSRMPTESLH